MCQLDKEYCVPLIVDRKLVPFRPIWKQGNIICLVIIKAFSYSKYYAKTKPVNHQPFGTNRIISLSLILPARLLLNILLADWTRIIALSVSVVAESVQCSGGRVHYFVYLFEPCCGKWCCQGINFSCHVFAIMFQNIILIGNNCIFPYF
jgi:hypothetical protein